MLKTLHRGFWLTAGLLFSVLAVIGLLLPIVPQIPFLLAAFFCFVRGSNRFKRWTEENRRMIRLRERFRKIRFRRNKTRKPGG